MTDTKTLDALIEALEAGEEYIERDIQNTLGGYRQSEASRMVMGAYQGSLDAAKALHEALLPKGTAMIGTDRPRAFVQCRDGSSVTCFGENPARAWLLAVLKAYRASL